MPIKNIIKLENVEKIYQLGEVEVPALRGVNLDVREGEFLMVIGPSGSGKSTMLNSIGCLDIPTKGNIFLDRHNISHLSESTLAQIRGRKIGFVFQQFNLISSLTALENVMLPMLFQDTTEIHRKKRATELLSKVGLAERLDHLPSQLSIAKDEYILIKKNNIIKPIKIGEFVDNVIKDSKNIEKIPNIKEGVRVIVNEPIKIATFNDKYKQTFTKLKQVIRHKSNSVYKIKTEYGYTIKCTGSHSIFVYKNGKILPKKVSDLSEGEIIPISMNLPNNSYFDNKTIDLVKELKKLQQHKEIIIKNEKIRFKVSHSKEAIPSKIKIDKRLCRILGDFASEGCVRHDKKNSRYYITFTLGINENKRANKIKEHFEKIFGIKLNKRIKKNHNTIVLETSNKLLSLIFLRIFKVGENCYSRNISDILFNVSNELKLEFLAGAYGDGTHRKKGNVKGKEKRREISIKTTSNTLAKKLHFLFLQIGYIPAIEIHLSNKGSRRKAYKLCLYGKQCEMFAKELNKRGYNITFNDIGVNGLGKTDILPNYIPFDEELINFVDLNRKLFTTTEYPGIASILRQDIQRNYSIKKDILNHILFKVKHENYKKIIQGDIGFVKIKEIKKINKTQYVYDVSDENNRFIGTHGIYLHNSGGESQRVAIARALANNPEVILADEPTGNLDSKSGIVVMETLKRLHKDEKKTIIMITHDADLTKYAERIAYLKDGVVVDIKVRKRA